MTITTKHPGVCYGDKCRLCWLATHDVRYQRLWNLPTVESKNTEAIATALAKRKPRISINEMVEKRRRCGQAKAAGLPCNEFGTGNTYISHGSGGLGDSVLGLCSILGYCDEHPRESVVYSVPRPRAAFVKLFEGPLIDEYVHNEKVPSPGRRIDIFPDGQGRTRIQKYCDSLGGVFPRLPQLRDHDAIMAHGKRFAGAVLLSPHVSDPRWRSRQYNTVGWADVAKELQRRGIRPVIVDDNQSRLGLFQRDVERTNRLSPEELIGACLNAACTIGIDSGTAHVSGILGKPTIVMTGPTVGLDIFGFYPDMTYIRGGLPCDGCWWRPPYNKGCDQGCPSLATIHPSAIVDTIVKVMDAKVPSLRIVSHHSEEYAALSELTWPSKQRWAQKHGASCENVPVRRAVWQHHYRSFLLNQLARVPHNGWLWVTGCDLMVTGDQGVQGLLGDNHVVLSVDANGINSDSLLLKNTVEVREMVLSVSRTACNNDQEALACVLSGRGNYREFLKELGTPTWTGGYPATSTMMTKFRHLLNRSTVKVSVVEQRAMNAYPSREYGFTGDESWAWHPGDLACHMPGKSLADRLRFFSQLKESSGV